MSETTSSDFIRDGAAADRKTNKHDGNKMYGSDIMKCPKCESETFLTFAIREIEVDRCRTCGGIWFDEKELVQLLRVSPQELTPLGKGGEQEDLNSKHGKCPRDMAPLLRVFSAINPAIIVDTCTQCRGIWLDGGEFAALL